MNSDFQIPSETVDVWMVNLSEVSAHLGACEQILSPDEWVRMQKFGMEHLCQRFILSRGILKLLAAKYLNSSLQANNLSPAFSPSSVTISYQELNKPYIAATSTLEFNLSHSEQRVVFAFSSNHPVGVDVEKVRTVDCLMLAQKVFTSQEMQALQALGSVQEQQQSFFQTWVRKEALLKGVGTGLSYAALRELDVSADRAIPGWSLVDLTKDLLSSEYCAALAVQTNLSMTIRTRQLDVELLGNLFEG